MKFLHISDLHIGKRLNEYSLIEDQRYILDKIIEITEEEKPDGVLIAGDVYDKSVPSAEAVGLLDEFLSKLSRTKSKVFIISGNHDSAERIAYGGTAFKECGIYISPVFEGWVEKVELCDEWGRVNIYLLPFIKPAHIRQFTDRDDILSYTDAVEAVIEKMNVNENERNVILSHQFVTGAERRDSEEVNVGGLDNVDGFVFSPFDYVALGHIHKCQAVGKENIRYSGTPLKYSASEAMDKKCALMVDLRAKGDLEIREIPLVPMRDYVKLEGKIEDLMKGENKTDYVHVTLTDEETVVDAYGKIRSRYPNMTELVFKRNERMIQGEGRVDMEKSPLEQFGEFYKFVNGQDMKEEQIEIVDEIMKSIKEGEI